MPYDDFMDSLAGQVDALLPQHKAAVFWLAGTELQSELTGAESEGWGSWFKEANDLSLEFILDGRVGNDLRRVWEQAAATTGPDESQLLHSAIICMSSPLAIAIAPETSVGSWIVEALFPLVQTISLDLFGDIAFPDDEGLDEVCADRRFQAAADYCTSLCASLRGKPSVSRDDLTQALEGAEVLIGRGREDG